MEEFSFEASARSAHAERTGILAFVFIGLFIGSVFLLALGESEKAGVTEREGGVVAEPDPRPGRRY
jgi:hypothetical protein